MENDSWGFKIYRKIRNQLVVLYFFFIAGKENYVELIKSLYWRCFSGLFYWFAYFNWPLQKVNARRDQPWAAKVGIRTPIHLLKRSYLFQRRNSILSRLSDCPHFKPCPHLSESLLKKVVPISLGFKLVPVYWKNGDKCF